MFFIAGGLSSCARHRERIEPPAAPVLSAPTIWPVQGVERRVTSVFGEPRPGGRTHKGLDIGIPEGTPVLATADGVVTFAGEFGGYGRMVVLSHRPGLETAYGHLLSLAVEVGQKVLQEQRIGQSGKTGNATGPHLHYEVRVDEKPTDPMLFLP